VVISQNRYEPFEITQMLALRYGFTSATLVAETIIIRTQMTMIRVIYGNRNKKPSGNGA